MHRDLIYLAYHFDDTKWSELLQKFLKPQTRAGMKIFDPAKIAPGEDYLHSRHEALGKSCVGVVLVSKDLLADDDMTSFVLPYLINAQKQECLVLLWILVGFCDVKSSELISVQPVLDARFMLGNFSQFEAERILWELCEHIIVSYEYISKYGHPPKLENDRSLMKSNNHEIFPLKTPRQERNDSIESAFMRRKMGQIMIWAIIARIIAVLIVIVTLLIKGILGMMAN